MAEIIQYFKKEGLYYGMFNKVVKSGFANMQKIKILDN